MTKHKFLLRVCSFALIFAMLCAFSTVTAFAITPEEEAAIAEFQQWLSGVTIRSAGSVSFPSGSSSGNATTANPSTEPFDAEAYALESIVLTNQERVKAGLDELEIDEDMMALAAVRAEELAEKWSHERPDGTRVSIEYRYAEIISIRSTAEAAVNGWIASTKGHHEIMLTEEYTKVGAGCYQADDGTIYWIQLFSR